MRESLAMGPCEPAREKYSRSGVPTPPKGGLFANRQGCTATGLVEAGDRQASVSLLLAKPADVEFSERPVLAEREQRLIDRLAVRAAGGKGDAIILMLEHRAH